MFNKKKVLGGRRKFNERKVVRAAGVALCSLAAIGCAVAAIIIGSEYWLAVTYWEIEVKDMPPALDGMKILHITDLHSKSPEKISVNIWERVNELRRSQEFDMIAITGDIVDRNAYQLEPHLPYLEELAKELPVFFVEGNHDHYSMRKLRPMLEGAGVCVLVDERAKIEVKGEIIEIVGPADFYRAELDESRVLLERRDNDEELRIVLAHQPQHVEFIGNVGIDAPCLMLSGHTHGGQFRAPLMPTLYAPGQGFLPKYGYGVYEVDEASLFVSKGIGSTGKVPFRIWNRPEICVINLRAEE